MQDKKITLEQEIIRHCAPVLAGIKVANLFRYQAENEEHLQKEIETVSQKLNVKGVYLEIVRRFEKGVLIYVFRRDRLEKELKKTENAKLLERYGYEKILCQHPEPTRNLFAKFKKCVTVYEKLYSEGRSISKLTVAA